VQAPTTYVRAPAFGHCRNSLLLCLEKEDEDIATHGGHDVGDRQSECVPSLLEHMDHLTINIVDFDTHEIAVKSVHGESLELHARLADQLDLKLLNPQVFKRRISIEPLSFLRLKHPTTEIAYGNLESHEVPP
jgi:hypothetical protein